MKLLLYSCVNAQKDTSEFQIILLTLSPLKLIRNWISIVICRSLLHQYRERIALNPNKIPTNNSVNQFAEALAKAWNEYGDPRCLIREMFSFLCYNEITLKLH